jgi:osmotically-inducible protein OsmY
MSVKAVAKEIEVSPPFAAIRDDEDIAAAALDRLFWDATVPRNAVTVKVEKGWITLTGSVEWHFQREAAGDDMRRLFGVLGVSDQISIKPRVNLSNISNVAATMASSIRINSSRDSSKPSNSMAFGDCKARRLVPASTVQAHLPPAVGLSINSSSAMT